MTICLTSSNVIKYKHTGWAEKPEMAIAVIVIAALHLSAVDCFPQQAPLSLRTRRVGVCRVMMSPKAVSEDAGKETQASMSKGPAHLSDQDTFRTVNGKRVNETEYEAMMTMLGHNVVLEEVNWMKKIKNVPIILQGKPSRNLPVRDFQSMESDKHYISKQTKWPSAVGALADSVQPINKRASDFIIATNSSAVQFNTIFDSAVDVFNSSAVEFNTTFKYLSIALGFSAVLSSISLFISALRN